MAKDTFSHELDEKSENIVYLLSLDSRKSITELAETLRLTRRQVEHRVQKLFSSGFVKRLVVNNAPPRVRLTLLVRLRSPDATALEPLRKLSAMIKLKETLGMYDLSILCDVSSEAEKAAIEKAVSDIVHGNIVRLDALAHDWEDTLGYKAFCHLPRLLAGYAPAQPAARTPSSQEMRALEALKASPALPNVELARRAGMSFRTLKKVLAALRADGFLRCTVDPDYEKLGLQFHNMLVKVVLGREGDFERYIAGHPRVHWVKHSRGRWDYILSIATRSTNELIDVTRQIRAENADILLDSSVLISKIRETRRH